MKTYRQANLLHSTAWAPEEGAQAIRSGIWWEAVRVPEVLGVNVVRAFRTFSPARLGPVIADLDMKVPSVYFLMPLDTAATWDAPASRGLGHHSYIVVPALATTSPPGPYWLVRPQDVTGLTDPRALLRFLRCAAPDNSAPA
ncbi:hypothetical protein ACTWJ8_02960 [Streptomyces sp. SDT5-1]|uniref:hypothetical protein n=1 Tax=Streptomyces sp. SDT5-1 TaxID=3406418 RepID=UPI003FD66AD0